MKTLLTLSHFSIQNGRIILWLWQNNQQNYINSKKALLDQLKQFICVELTRLLKPKEKEKKLSFFISIWSVLTRVLNKAKTTYSKSNLHPEELLLALVLFACCFYFLMSVGQIIHAWYAQCMWSFLKSVIWSVITLRKQKYFLLLCCISIIVQAGF